MEYNLAKTGLPRQAALCFALLLGLSLIHAEVPSATVDKAGYRRLFIAPSSAKLFLGSASLIVDPLAYHAGSYSGDYEIKVVPYFFKSENGTLVLQTPEDSIRKLEQGLAVDFIGKATNNKKGKPKNVTGRATPAADDRGAVTFTVTTDNGPVIFKTSYRLGE